jgi:hypothetical protein
MFVSGAATAWCGKTLLVLRELYRWKEALDDAITSGTVMFSEGSTAGTDETFDQLTSFSYRWARRLLDRTMSACPVR